MQVIGFSTKFHTLWSLVVTPQHLADAYGQWHRIADKHEYTYYKNISHSLDEAIAKYPDAIVDLDLKGSKSFETTVHIGYPIEFAQHGKYAGKLLSDVFNEDLQYFEWYLENVANKELDYMKFMPNYLALLQQRKEDEAAKLSARLLEEGEANVLPDGLQTITFTTNSVSKCIGYWAEGEIHYYKNMGDIEPLMEYQTEDHNSDLVIYGCYANKTQGNGTKPTILFILMPDRKDMYYQGCVYYLPMIDGKAKRLKNKSFELNLETVAVLNTNLEYIQVMRMI